MPGSQLKRLKAALKDQGVVGPQKSKKQKRENARNPKANSDKRMQRGEALSMIREQFNPFQFKTSARGPKFEVTTNKPVNEKSLRGIMGRPGMAKAAGEEKRRQTLLVEMQRRNKVGGLVDRRFAENDPNMSAEDKMMERFVQERLRTHKKNAVFNLEDEGDDAAEEALTHMGKPLMFGDLIANMKDELDEDGLSSGDDSDASLDERKALKRARLQAAQGEEEDGQPERKKSKKEIYEEIIAKSKAHKIDRQRTKEADQELRLEIDKELPDLHALLSRVDKPQAKGLNEDPLTTAVMGKDALDTEYDLRVKKLAADKRSQPTTKTKTEEEQAAEVADKLRELEQQRIQRMKGMVEVDSEDEDEVGGKGHDEPDVIPTLGKQFGLGQGIRMQPTATELGLDDEDDFLIEEDLIASGSELDLEEMADEASEDSSGEDEEESGLGEDDLTRLTLNDIESKELSFKVFSAEKGNDSDGIPYSFPCPQTHPELLATVENIEIVKLPVVVQRIRAIYHPRLDSKNKERLGNFAKVLVQHIAFLGQQSAAVSVLESLIRHVHSLAKNFPIEVAQGYREMLEEAAQNRPLALQVSDLIILTAIGTTFPTSDHFHQVVTPALLCVGRFLGQKIPQTLADYAKGTYLAMLAVEYQQLSKRFVPEVMNFLLNTCALGPVKAQKRPGFYPHHEPQPGLRIKDASDIGVRKLRLADCEAREDMSTEESNSLKVALLDTTLSVFKAAAELWSTHAAFFETFQPVVKTLEHLSCPDSRKHLPGPLVARIRDVHAFVARLSQLARVSRRPLELHHHRPRAIRTVVPRFDEDGFTGRVRDPDRERAELSKLRAEHRRERKGAMRELRRDASFVARENLRQKRARDSAYEAKYKRIVAEIQGEEGREANAYAKEKKMRQRKRH